MILTKIVVYRGKEIEVSKLKHCSIKEVLIECPVCHTQRYAAYRRIKDNQRCHSCALKSLIKTLSIGEKYHRWIILDIGSKPGRSLCRCDCGTIKEVGNYSLTSGRAYSCGCFRKENAAKNMRETTKKQRRENHPNWTGGISDERDLFHAKKETKDWKKYIYEKDEYTCKSCGQVGYKLNVHHIQSYSEHIDLRLDPDNGITFCDNCHRNFHKIYGRKNIGIEHIKLFIEEV